MAEPKPTRFSGHHPWKKGVREGESLMCILLHFAFSSRGHRSMGIWELHGQRVYGMSGARWLARHIEVQMLVPGCSFIWSSNVRTIK